MATRRPSTHHARPFAAALARAHAGDARAWDDFAALREDARRSGDARLALLAAAGLTVAGHGHGRFEHFPACVDELLPWSGGAPDLAPDDELLVLSGLLLGLMMCRPRDPAATTTAARLLALLEEGREINLTLVAARALLFHFDGRDLLAPAMHVYALIGSRTGDPAATPHRVGEWLNIWSRCAHYGQEPLLAEQAVAQMRALARDHGLRSIEFAVARYELDTILPRGDVAAARDAIARAESLVDPAQLRQIMQLELTKTRYAGLRGEADSALHHATRARRLAVELHTPPVVLSLYVVNEAQARLLNGDFEGARRALIGQIAALPEGYAGEIEAMVAGIDAYLAVRDGHSDADARLVDLWRMLRERRSYNLFEGFPDLGARLCVRSLERGIETDFVRSLIGKCRLVAPENAPASWPWPLRIQAFGGFAVWRDDVALAAEGKAQRRPLALLQAVIALGAFREELGVEVGRLVEILWPDEDAVDPKSSFEAALARLRRWLGVDGVLKLAEGRLSLNPRVVWCDVDAFERVCSALQAAVAPHADTSLLPRLLAQLGALYRGKLFGAATPEPWSVLARERLRMRFARSVADAGALLEARQQWPQALRLYEATLARDMLAEPIHQALMRCHLALGQQAEAWQAYGRCATVLRAELGLAPSTETRLILERIHGMR